MEDNRMIDRESAIEAVQDAIRIISESNPEQKHVITKLKEIKQCIRAERSGFHIWNAYIYDSCIILRDSEELYLQRDIDEQRQLQEEYAFKPSMNEHVDSPLGENWCECV